MSYELEAEAIFNEYRPRQTTPEDSILAYIHTRLTKLILVKDMEKFESGLLDVKYPEAYIARLRKTLALVTHDLNETRTYFRQENIRVSDKPVKVQESSILFNYWIKGQTGQCGGSSQVMRKEVKRYVQYYLTERIDNN